MASYTIRRTCVPRKVRRSTKLRGLRHFSWTFCEEHGLSCTGNPNLSSPEYLRQDEISVCKVLVAIKVVPVKNHYFLHPKFEFHRYQKMNRCLYWCSFYWKKYGAYVSHELIIRLTAILIWYDILTISQIWPSNRQLSYFF